MGRKKKIVLKEFNPEEFDRYVKMVIQNMLAHMRAMDVFIKYNVDLERNLPWLVEESFIREFVEHIEKKSWGKKFKKKQLEKDIIESLKKDEEDFKNLIEADLPAYTLAKMGNFIIGDLSLIVDENERQKMIDNIGNGSLGGVAKSELPCGFYDYTFDFYNLKTKGYLGAISKELVDPKVFEDDEEYDFYDRYSYKYYLPIEFDEIKDVLFFEIKTKTKKWHCYMVFDEGWQQREFEEVCQAIALLPVD